MTDPQNASDRDRCQREGCGGERRDHKDGGCVGCDCRAFLDVATPDALSAPLPVPAGATTDEPRSAVSVALSPPAGATERNGVTQWQHPATVVEPAEDNHMPHIDADGACNCECDHCHLDITNDGTLSDLCLCPECTSATCAHQYRDSQPKPTQWQHGDDTYHAAAAAYFARWPQFAHFVPRYVANDDFRAAVDAAFRHQLRRIGWASIDELQAAYVQTDRWYEAADEEVKRQRSEIAELRERLEALDLDWSKVVSSRDEWEGLAGRHARDRDTALAERDEARRQLAETKLLLVCTSCQGADQECTDCDDTREEHTRLNRLVNALRHSENEMRGEVMAASLQFAVADDLRRQLAAIRTLAEQWTTSDSTHPDSLVKLHAGRAILRLLDGDQP